MNAAWRLSPRVLFIPLVLFVALPWHGEVKAAQLHLTWRDNSSDENGFIIERRTKGDEKFVQIATQGANVTSYTDSDVTAGTTYCYRVRAFNAVGSSPYSQEFCATPTEKGQPSQVLGAKSPAVEPSDSARPADSFDPRQRRGRKRVGDGWVQEIQPAQ